MANGDVDISPLSDILGFCVSRKVVEKVIEEMKDKSLKEVIEKLKNHSPVA
jgi:predicted regulator of amino acid metabolism with ACT domain